MIQHNFGRMLVGLFALCLLVIPQAMALADNFLEKTVDRRIMLAYKVNPEPVQAMLPDGWTAIAFPKGPIAGTNFLVILIDRLNSRDDKDKNADPSVGLISSYVVLAKQTDGKGIQMFVVGVDINWKDYEAYGNTLEAVIDRTVTETGVSHSENWTIKPADGGELTFALKFTTGKTRWKTDEVKSFSNVKPGYYHVYRRQYLTGLLMSEGMGMKLDGAASVTNSMPRFAKMFDGSEKLMALIHVPVLVQEVFEP